MTKVLFVCGQNRLRSPTAEAIFADRDGLECLSAGVHDSADVPVDPELLEWADVIIAMEAAHRDKLRQKFRRYLNGKTIVVLNIPDDYQYLQPALVERLQRSAGPLLDRLARRGA